MIGGGGAGVSQMMGGGGRGITDDGGQAGSRIRWPQPLELGSGTESSQNRINRVLASSVLALFWPARPKNSPGMSPQFGC